MDPLKPLLTGLPSRFEKLAEQADAVASLTESVRAGLPEMLRSHVISAFRRGTVLVVVVDSAAWADRVRYAGRKLRTALEQRGESGLTRVRVSVRPPVRP
jgi:hypothetical protein